MANTNFIQDMFSKEANINEYVKEYERYDTLLFGAKSLAATKNEQIAKSKDTGRKNTAK